MGRRGREYLLVSGHPSLYAEVKRIKSLTLHTQKGNRCRHCRCRIDSRPYSSLRAVYSQSRDDVLKSSQGLKFSS